MHSVNIIHGVALYKLTTKCNFFVGEQVQHLVVDGVGLLASPVALGQHAQHVGRRLAGVGALRLVRARLVRRPAPPAPDAREAAPRQPA